MLDDILARLFSSELAVLFVMSLMLAFAEIGLLLLVMVAAAGCITTSYGGGAEGARSKLGSVFLPMLIAVVIVLIFDISHPRVGLIQSASSRLTISNNSSGPTGPSIDEKTFIMSKGYKFMLAMLSLSIALSAFVGSHSTYGSSQSGSANQTHKTQQVDTCSQATVDSGDLRLRYQPRKKSPAATENHAVGSDPKTIEKLISDLNARLKLPFDIYVVFVDCDSPDAFYDPETREVTLCYQLIDDYYDLFAQKLKDKKKLDEAVKAATLATFFHELGHGLVDAWKIPITGREEDAVDQLSTIVLIEATEDGEQMALEGALSFKLYADLTTSKKIYWDEHSLDEQRFFDTICLVYGHDEKKYAYLVKNGTLPEERASGCNEDYARVNRSWRQLLAPYLKTSAQPRPKLR